MSLNVLKPVLSSKLILCATLVLGGCALAELGELRLETANRLASAAWMVGRDIPAGQFVLHSYERMHEHNAAANVYIEGDGSVDGLGGSTPRNPVALHLATKDDAENVVYLARPCQYAGFNKEKEPGCAPESEYMNKKRYSTEVIDAYSAALDEISKRYDIKGFNLIGYDGGAAIAMLIAAKRSDILSVRTVAGVLDHDVQSQISGRPALEDSLNPVTQASALSTVPQYHFIGGEDDIVPPAILQSYMQSTPPSPCIHSLLVQEAAHDKGWVSKWPELLKLPVSCYGASEGFDAYNVGSMISKAGETGLAPRVPSVYQTVPELPEKP